MTRGLNQAGRIKLWLLATLAVLVVLPLLLIAGALLALRSETGTAWVIEQVPGLDVTDGRGSLLDHWQAGSLRWQGYGVGLQVTQPVLDWSPSCLFSLEVCLDEVQAGTIDLTLQPGEPDDTPRSAIDLPALILPLAVTIGNVRLGPFTVNGSPVWDQAHLAATGSGADWTIHALDYQGQGVTVAASGTLETRRDWPVNLALTVDLPPPSGNFWQVVADLSGSVRDLRVQARSEGYLAATLRGEVQPLEPAVPLRLELASAGFLPHESVPVTLTLQDWQIALQGNLDSGFRTRSTARLPATTGPVATTLTGHLTTSGVTDLTLQLVADRTAAAAAGEDGASGPGELRVAGDISWSAGLQADARVAMTGFPWYGLLPDLAAPPVLLETLTGNARYRDGRYDASLQAGVSGPLGDASLASELTGDMASVTLSQLTISSGAGELSGQGELGFAGQLSWQAQLGLDDFNPGFWLPVLESKLSGEIRSEGRLTDPASPELTASWAIDGTWQGKPAAAKGELVAADGSWQLAGAEVTVADNRVTGSGRWGEQLAAALELDLPSPQLFLAGLGGRMNGSLQLSGTPQQPNGEVRLQGRGLEWQDSLAITDLDVTGSLANNRTVEVDVRARQIESAGQQLAELAVKLAGNPADHTLDIRALHDDARVELGFAGALNDAMTAWSGALARGELVVPEQDQQWRLAAPASLDFAMESGRDGPEGAGPSLTFGAHCWRWQQSSLCADDQILLPQQTLAYRLDQFPTEALAPLMPPGLRWQALINGEFSLAMTPQGPDGELVLSTGAGEVEVLVQGDWQALAYDRLETRVRLEPELATLMVNLAGPELGDFETTVSLDPRSQTRELDGSFRLDGLDLAVANAFVGLDELTGTISGQGRITGPLMKPEVYGELVLADGRVMDPRVPVPFEELVLELELQGYRADLSGRWKSNERGGGTLGGTFDWQQSPTAEVKLKGTRVPFAYEPYARLEMAPDLTILFADGDLSVSGRVDVPRGSIEIRELPEQAVAVSEDEVIVGVEREEPAVRALKMDVTVVVGEDEVTFSGFGVTGELEGTLRIGNDMDTRGSLQLVNGHYEAYGQELELRRARLVFVGAVDLPYLDIEAVRKVDTVTAGIRLSGPATAPETEVFSEPPMPQSEALAYVILGRPLRSQGDQGQMSRAALSLGLTQTSKITQGIGEEFGIQNLILEAEGSGEQTSVVASGYITEDLSVRYGVGVFEPITTIAIRYDLGRYFYLEAASGLAASLDIFYTRDF